MNNDTSPPVPPSPQTETTSAPPFDSCIHTLLNDIEGLRALYFPFSAMLNIANVYNAFTLGQFFDTHGTPSIPSESGAQFYDIPPSAFADFKKLDAALKNTTSVVRLFPESLLLTLVSRFDAFIGRLLRNMMLTQPAVLKQSQKTLTISQIIDFGDYDTAREYVIEKEVESVLRQSHANHFEWLETKLNMPLTKDLPSWKTFIEITERRNLFVHCDGIVSHQYLSTCEEHGVTLPSTVSIGTQLDVTPPYFDQACDCFIELAIKLTHVIWRKLLPKDLERADAHLNIAGFEILLREQFFLASEVFRFSYEVLKRHSSECSRMTAAINLAQCYKWLGDESKCVTILDKEDFSASALKFQVCNAVLRDDFKKAIMLIKQIGTSGEISANDYRDWPVFRILRKETGFLDTYEAIFGMKLGIRAQSAVTTERITTFVNILKDQIQTVAGPMGAKTVTPELASDVWKKIREALINAGGRPASPSVEKG